MASLPAPPNEVTVAAVAIGPKNAEQLTGQAEVAAVLKRQAAEQHVEREISEDEQIEAVLARHGLRSVGAAR